MPSSRSHRSAGHAGWIKRNAVGVGIVLTDKDRDMRDLINHTATNPEHGVAAAARIPRDPQPWGEIVVVGMVRLVESTTDLNQANRRIEVGKLIMFLMNRHADVVTKSGVNRQSRSHAPIILNEGPERLLIYNPPAVTDEDETATSAAYVARRETFQIAEPDLTRTKRVPQVIGAAGAKLTTKFKIVLADHVSCAVGKLQSLVGRGVERPGLVSPQGVLDKSGDANFRQAEIVGSVTPVFRP